LLLWIYILLVLKLYRICTRVNPRLTIILMIIVKIYLLILLEKSASFRTNCSNLILSNDSTWNSRTKAWTGSLAWSTSHSYPTVIISVWLLWTSLILQGCLVWSLRALMAWNLWILLMTKHWPWIFILTVAWVHSSVI
jgi:hypothetical protein